MFADQLVWGIHSQGLSGMDSFWVPSSMSFNLFFTREIGVERSEFWLEPGTIICLSLSLHLSNILPIRPFQIEDPL